MAGLRGAGQRCDLRIHRDQETGPWCGRTARYETSVRRSAIIKLDCTLTEGSGDLRVMGPDFEQMLVTFLGWAPAPIRNVDALVRAVAPACRLLRDKVADQLAREQLSAGAGSGLTKQLFSGLAADWRQLLFPTADDGEFADGYAQTVTFGLLYAAQPRHRF